MPPSSLGPFSTWHKELLSPLGPFSTWHIGPPWHLKATPHSGTTRRAGWEVPVSHPGTRPSLHPAVHASSLFLGAVAAVLVSVMHAGSAAQRDATEHRALTGNTAWMVGKEAITLHKVVTFRRRRDTQRRASSDNNERTIG